MPQIASIQTAPLLAPPGAPANNDTESFSPHLDKAIASRKDQQSSWESGSKPSEQTTNDKYNISNNKEITSSTTKDTEQGQKTSKTEEALESVVDDTQKKYQPAMNASNMVIVMAMDQAISQTVSKNPAESSSPLFEFISSNFSSSNNAGGQQIISSQKPWPTSLEGDLFTNPLAEAMDLSIAETDSLPLAGNFAATQSSNNVFLQQLQKIIENSDESGKLSISVTGTTLKVPSSLNDIQSPLPLTITSSELTEFDSASSAILFPNNSEISVEKANQTPTSMRHSIQQQYYEGKIVPQNEQENQTSSESGQQKNSFLPKAEPAGEGNIVSAGTPDQTNTFAQPLALVQEGQKPPTVEVLRPVTLPSGSFVQQEEVIRQIAERLQISRRDFDTKVNIQLHPAELGELKIDLSVKGGAVRANVVASSHYAQEIIEKNMVKLRTVLESQGFTIDEISVTAKSDTVGDFNLFDRQLFSQNDYTPLSTKKTGNAGQLFALEDSNVYKHTAATGVNLKI
jgi:flagellar hook-length control protein FliK